MRKKILVLLCSAFLSACLFGCANPGLPYIYKELRIYGSLDDTAQTIPLIKDVEQKNAYVSRQEFLTDNNLSFRMQAGMYDNGYFENRDLIIMCYGSCASEIKRLQIKENYVEIIFRKNKQKEATCEYAPVAVFIEIEKLPQEITGVRAIYN